MKQTHLLSLGAGVQSSTMALMAAAGEIVPMPAAAIFADTQAEPPSVYKWLDWLERQLPFRVYRVTAGNLSESATRMRERLDGTGTYVRNSIPVYVTKPDGKPAILMRGCTRDFKLRPIVKLARRLKKTAGADEAVQWIGISTDEAQRMKNSREKGFRNRWPLIENGVSRSECIAWMQKHGYPKPPRSACVFCPYHSDVEWVRLLNEEPEAFKQAADFEQRLQRAVAASTAPTATAGQVFLHRSRLPILQVQFDGTSGREQFGEECEGMCGV